MADPTRPDPLHADPAAAAPQRPAATARRPRRVPVAPGLGGGGDEAPHQIVPPQSVAGRALILVVAIMSFLACLTVGAVTLVRDAARDWQVDVSREITIQVKPIDGVPIEAELQKALRLAEGTLGISGARLVPEAESRRLLEPWLGTGVDLAELPVPRLVQLTLSDPAGADLAGLRERLKTVKGAALDDHSVWAARLRTMAGTMVAAGVVVLVLVLTAMVLSVVFATRGAMAGNRDVIEVLHFVGAEDGFIAREFMGHFLVLGLKGGAGGGFAAMVAFFVFDRLTRDAPGSAVADQMQALFGGVSVGVAGYLGALGIVFLVAILTAVTSRITVKTYLAALD